jgi:two-component system LytT family response regulator
MSSDPAVASLRTVIVDDEPLALIMLRSILEPISGVEIIAECCNGREAIAEIRASAPDLVFIDIHMPGKNGFEVVKDLQADVMPMIVFATAYDNYAIKAFELHAVDYILKPLDPARVLQAVERAQLRALSLASGETKTGLIAAIEEIARRGEAQRDEEPAAAAEAPGNKLVIRDAGAVTLVPMEEIDWVDAAGDYMCVHVGGATHILRSTLKELLERLDSSLFRRIHRSTLVNLLRINGITPLKKGECTLHLVDGTRLKVSRNYRDAIKPLLKMK